MRRLFLAAVSACALALTFTLHAQTPAPKPFFFLQFGDPQFGMFTANKDFAQETANFELAVATANRWKPAFIVVSGDLVNKAGDAAQMAEFKRIARKLDPAIRLYPVSGNHDLENTPTPATIAAYVKAFGPDHYAFQYQGFHGIVLNSTLMVAPDQAPDLLAAQDAWLEAELARARASASAQHIVVFQHHPLFVADPFEPTSYFNVPLARRATYLDWYRMAGVQAVMAGHYHRNAHGWDRGLEMITTGPVGMPLGEGSQSGLRVVIVTDTGLSHRYYTFGELPNTIDLSGRK